jgi:hypothetical protein
VHDKNRGLNTLKTTGFPLDSPSEAVARYLGSIFENLKTIEYEVKDWLGGTVDGQNRWKEVEKYLQN